jgi:hypothetical protein
MTIKDPAQLLGNMDADEIDPVVAEGLTPYQVEWLRRQRSDLGMQKLQILRQALFEWMIKLYQRYHTTIFVTGQLNKVGWESDAGKFLLSYFRKILSGNVGMTFRICLDVFSFFTPAVKKSIHQAELGLRTLSLSVYQNHGINRLLGAVKILSESLAARSGQG